MTLKGDAKFKGKLTRDLKNDTRNFVNFHTSSWKSENLHFDGLFLSKAYKVLDEKVKKNSVSWPWRVMQSLKKNWLLAPKMTRGIWEILMRAVASLKIYSLMCNIRRKHIIFEPKKYGGVMCHNTEERFKIWGETDWTWPNIWKSQNLHFNRLPLTKVYNVWPKKVPKSYSPRCCRVMQRKANS